jgi:pyruvate kinase
MLTLQIDNSEIENFIDKRYGVDTQTLLQDFATFVKVSMDDGYPSINTEEAKRRVAKAVKELEEGTAKMLSQEEYDKEMQIFMKSL